MEDLSVQVNLERYQKDATAALKRKLPSPNKEPRQLNKAINYAVLSGGKRIRAALIYATGEALGAHPNALDDICAAVEMVHAFSLIHDDLPSLDNDDFRRGKPTCHKAFGEAIAILAGDSLQSLAFEVLANIPPHTFIEPQIKLQMIQLLARALGSLGLAGGEVLDLEMVNQHQTVSIKKLETMYKLKTGCLLNASILLGALAANCQDEQILHHLSKFGEYIGLAFQIHDDIIGIESDTQTLGKKQGADLELNKPVYPVLAGMNRAKKRTNNLYKRALGHLDKIKEKMNTDQLRAIASYIIERNY